MAAVSDDLLAMVVHSAGDAIVGEDLDGTVLVWNQSAERLYGYAAAEMLGQRADRLYPPGRRPDEVAARECVSERVRRDGATVRVCVRAAPLVDRTGLTVGVVTMSRAADGPSLTARVGHELRTPLNAIIGFTGTLLMRLPGPLNEEQEHQLRLVQTSAELLLSRVNQLSRPGDVPAKAEG